MNNVFVKAIQTGRKTFGNKLEDKQTKQTILGVPMIVKEFDTWSSDEFGNGEYIRITAIEF